MPKSHQAVLTRRRQPAVPGDLAPDRVVRRDTHWTLFPEVSPAYRHAPRARCPHKPLVRRPRPLTHTPGIKTAISCAAPTACSAAAKLDQKAKALAVRRASRIRLITSTIARPTIRPPCCLFRFADRRGRDPKHIVAAASAMTSGPCDRTRASRHDSIRRGGHRTLAVASAPLLMPFDAHGLYLRGLKVQGVLGASSLQLYRVLYCRPQRFTERSVRMCTW